MSETSQATTNYLSVVIVDQQQDKMGIVANAAFVLGLTAGREMPAGSFGPDVIDGDGSTHRYLTNIGHFVRKAGQNKIRNLRDTFRSHPDVSVTDYTEEAAPSDYQEYADNIALRKGEELKYRALHIYGPESVVMPLTKNLSRLD